LTYLYQFFVSIKLLYTTQNTQNLHF